MQCDFLSIERLNEITQQIHNVKICLIGDICMDFYWYADMKRSRLSRETPHFPLPVIRETATPGAAGNVMNNIHALQPENLSVVSCVADDWRGQAVLSWMDSSGIDTAFIHHRKSGITPAYCKPVKAGISDVVYEDPRIDFENFEPLGLEDEAALIINIDLAAENCDLIVVSDQFTFGVISDAVREHISELGKTKTIIVDSRERIGLYRNVILKPNELEAATVVGREFPDGMTEEDCLSVAEELKESRSRPVIVTAGDRGAVWSCGEETVLVPTLKAEPPVDIVGAGDTFLSAFSCALAAGADGREAVMFGNLASGVTVKKIGTTGTATAEEITGLYLNRYVESKTENETEKEKEKETDKAKEKAGEREKAKDRGKAASVKSSSKLKNIWSKIYEKL